MTAHTAAGGASLLAHGVHWTIVLGGTAGMLALVLPSLLDRFAPRLARYVDPAPRRPRDEHERRVHEVRRHLLAGAPNGVPTATPFFPGTTRHLDEPPERPSYAACLTVPVALAGSLAAAGVHAAVGAAHLSGQPLLGSLFVLCAFAQLAWAAQLLHAPSAPVVTLGLVGNAGLVTAWLATRLPVLPLPGSGAEPFGVWDVLAAGWQVAVVVACASLLASGSAATRPAAWRAWRPAARAVLVGSALLLVLTSTSGVPA